MTCVLFSFSLCSSVRKWRERILKAQLFPDTPGSTPTWLLLGEVCFPPRPPHELSSAQNARHHHGLIRRRMWPYLITIWVKGRVRRDSKELWSSVDVHLTVDKTLLTIRVIIHFQSYRKLTLQCYRASEPMRVCWRFTDTKSLFCLPSVAQFSDIVSKNSLVLSELTYRIASHGVWMVQYLP